MRDATAMTFEKYLESVRTCPSSRNGSCQNTLRASLRLVESIADTSSAFNDRDFSRYKFMADDLPYRDIGRLLSKIKLVKLIWKKLIELERGLL